MVNFVLIIRAMLNGCKAAQKASMMKKTGLSWKQLNDKERNPQKYARLTDEEVAMMKKKFEAKQAARRAARDAEEAAKE